MSFHVYGIHDRPGGELLYIGCSNNPERRIREHYQTRQSVRTTVELKVWATFHFRRDAQNYEARLIHALRPPFNTIRPSIDVDWMLPLLPFTSYHLANIKARKLEVAA